MDNLLSLDDLKTFYVIADLGSLSAAVRSTKISQPTMTRSIQRLESIFKCSLYTRGRDGIVLTPSGITLYHLLKERLAPLNHIKDIFDENISSLAGELNIATTYTFGSLWLPRRLDKFQDQYPNILLDIYATDEKIDVFTEVDAAVSFQPYCHKDIVDYQILSYQLKIYASEQYLKKYGTPKSLDDLKNHKLIVYGEKTRAPTPQVNWLAKNKHGLYIHQPVVKLNSAQGIIEAVKKGVGLATLASYIAKDDPELIEIKIPTAFPPVEIYFSYHRSLAGSARVKVFREFITQELNAN